MRRHLEALGRPAVIAHRGASRRAPENSLGALRLAAEEGADGVEFDVQACGSGELVVFHDRTLARCTGHPGTLTETPLAELRRLTLDRVAESHGLAALGERIPTLDEWLASVPVQLLVNLEVKADTFAQTVIANPCVDAVERAGLASRTIVSSFHPGALLRIAGRRIDRGALVEPPGWRASLAAGLLASPSAVNPEVSLVTPGRVKWWHAAGYRVAAWTVDDPDEARRLFDAGVDVAISNRPDLIRPIAERYRRTAG